MIKRNVVIGCFCMIASSIFAQSKTAPKYLVFEDYKNNIETLREQFGYLKNFEKKYEIQMLAALSFVPELSKVPIKLVYGRSKTFLKVQPTTSSMFKNKAKRVYKISLNERPRSLKGLDFAKVPFTAQVGILIHELEHILHYEQHKNLKLVQIALAYTFSQKYHTRFEQETDFRTIQRGAGWLLYAFQKHIITNGHKRLIKYKDKYYLMPEEILKHINTTFRKKYH